MLRLSTPNGEVATINDFCPPESGWISGRAVSPDFEAVIKLRARYSSTNLARYLVCVLTGSSASDSGFIELLNRDRDRIGGLISIGALCVDDHPLVSNEYFYALASAALRNLIQDTLNQSIVSQYTIDGTYEIEDFYVLNSWILVLNQNLEGTLTIDEALPFLAAHGFGYCNPGRPFSPILASIPLEKRKIRTRKLRESVLTTPFVRDLYRRMLPTETSPLGLFVMLYQVFELLMHEGFEEKLALYKEKVANFSGTASDLRTIHNDLTAVLNERDRIRLCVDDARIKESDHQELINCCKSLLHGCAKNASEHIGHLIYDVRNLVFHGFRELPENGLELVSRINAELCVLMPALMR